MCVDFPVGTISRPHTPPCIGHWTLNSPGRRGLGYMHVPNRVGVEGAEWTVARKAGLEAGAPECQAGGLDLKLWMLLLA